MSRIAERVIRRLIRAHGFVFEFDPCNYRVACDRYAVSLNVNGGCGVIQWTLCHEHSTLIGALLCRIQLRPEHPAWTGAAEGWTSVEIGSDLSAADLLSYNRWTVVYEPTSHSYWINPALRATKHERNRKAQS